ncbi:MAG TPA: glycoside hydrolase family 3 C-terminal domain-containing protein, partial [Novosphingobium sp.]|nr:glycoside hydrolase family 3 C-terminal domain-containing protein [Novosphingobium sp.]
GGHADVGVLSGGGSSQVRSVGGAPVEIPLKSGPAASFARTTWHASSPLEAVRAVAPQATVTYVDGRDAAAAADAAAHADIAIVFATQWRTEAEDLADLSLPDGQDGLISTVAAAQAKTVVVLETGGPVRMPWLGQAGAVLAAWYPGQRGGQAIANILFGRVNPSGHLPITFPAADAQAPRPAPVNLAQVRADDAASNAGSAGGQLAIFPVEYGEGADAGYRWYARQGLKPLFPFGYGLSYTRFAYGHFDVRRGPQGLTASLDVTNAGQRAGADVPQIYAAVPGGGMARLVAFGRVQLAPGETRHLTLPIEMRAMARWQGQKRRWKLEAGSYRFTLGRHAGDVQASRSVAMPARELAASVR